MTRTAARCAVLLLIGGCVADPIAAFDDLAAAPSVDLATADDLASIPEDLASIPEDLVAPLDDLQELDPDLAPPAPDLLVATLTWTESNSGLEGGNFYGITAGGPNGVWVQTLYDVFESTDGASHFSLVWHGDSSVSAIAASGSTLYIAPSAGGIFRRVGQGSFEDLTVGPGLGTPPPDGTAGTLVAGRSSANGLLFASTGQDIYLFDPSQTTNRWELITTEANNFAAGPEIISRMVVDDDSNNLYLSSTSGHWRWGGSSWSLDSVIAPSPGPLDAASSGSGLVRVTRSGASIFLYSTGAWGSALAAPAFLPDYLSLGASRQLLGCSNEGVEILAMPNDVSWSVLNGTAGASCSGIARADDRVTAYVATGRGVGIYAEGSGSLAVNNAGIHGLTIFDFAWDAFAADRVFAATDHGLFRSTDAGLTWQAIGDLPAAQSVERVAVAFFKGQVDVYVVSGGQLYRSIDGGATFFDAKEAAIDVAASQTVEGRLFVCNATGVRMSDDFGETFTTQSSFSGCVTMALINDDTLFAATTDRLYRSLTADTQSPDLTQFADTAGVKRIAPVASSDVFALVGAPASLSRITLTGETPIPLVAGGRLLSIAAPGTQQGLLVGTRQGVYRSATLTLVALARESSGLPIGDVTAIGCERKGAARCLVGVEERGAYRTP